jgi:hypothetical protein
MNTAFLQSKYPNMTMQKLLLPKFNLMKISQLLSIVVLLLFASNAKGQDFELGKVSIAELQEKFHPKDTSAVAAILFEKGTNTFHYSQEKGFEVVLKVKTRIKIYKKEGYNWATKKVAYYAVTGSNENVYFSNAATYNLVEGKIVKTKLKSEGEFNEEINKYWKQKKITMPNVKEGCVIEYEYYLPSSRLGSLRDWYFQSTIPVNYSEYTNSVPEYFRYNENLKGFVSPKITVEKKNGYLTLTSKERTQTGIGNGYSSTTTFSNDKIDFIETVSNYLVKNMPALKEELYVNNIDNYTTSLSQELTMTKYPNSVEKRYSTDWESVVKTIYEYDDFGPELKKTGYFEDDLDIVLKGKVTAENKIEAILNHVKSVVKWNNYYGYSCMNGVKKAYKEKSGNIADINLMLTAMLRYAGFDANPVLVSTRSNGISFFANRNAYNYVIAAVENGDKTTLLDGSDLFSAPDILPFRTLNWSGRLIRKDGSSVPVDLMPKRTSLSSVMLSYAVNEKGEVSGNCRHQKTDYNAMMFRNEIKDIKEDSFLEKMENNRKIDVKEYSRSNETLTNEPIIESFAFAGNQSAELIGGKIYISPLLFFVEKNNPFKQETRDYPIDYGFPFIERYSVSIQIPEGYQIEKLPQASAMAMMENLGGFKFLSNVSGNSIQVIMTHQVNASIIAADNYPMLKEYYKKMIDKENEKIVLSKI